MKRPDFVTHEDIARWSENIDNDLTLPKEIAESVIIREVCYAGLWLTEHLEKLQCPDVLISRIQFSAATLCFGRDPWEVHQSILEKYKNNELIFESDDDIIKN